MCFIRQIKKQKGKNLDKNSLALLYQKFKYYAPITSSHVQVCLNISCKSKGPLNKNLNFDILFIIFSIWKSFFLLLSRKLFGIPCWHQRNVEWLSTFLDTTSTVWNVKMHLETMNSTKKNVNKTSFQQIVIYLWQYWG